MENKVKKMSSYWFLPLIIGILFIGVGIWVFFTPLASYLALAFLFCISFLVSGLLEIIYSIANRSTIEHWGTFLTGGILNLIIGVLLLCSFQVSLLVLSFYVGFWLLFRSIMTISTSFDLKKHGAEDWVFLLILGVLGTILSFVLLWNPVFAGLTIVYWTAFALITFGIYYIWFSFKIKKITKYVEDLD